MPLEIYRPITGNLDTSNTLPISRGGTGATDTVTARDNLGALAAEGLGKDFARLDEKCLLSLANIPQFGKSQVSLTGFKKITAGRSAFFKITNFSAFRVYQLSIVEDTGAATISRTGDTIYLTTVANGKNTAGFRINGREFTVNLNI